MDNLVNFLNNSDPIILGFYHSTFFSVIKFLLGIYAIVILADIVLLLIQRGLGGDIRTTLIGMNIPAELTTRKGKLAKKWSKIKNELERENESAWKVAIIEADNLIDDLIKKMQYPGKNMGERLEGINPGQIENIEELKQAHKVRNQIIHNESFKLSKKQAETVMGYYENFLRYFEVVN